MWRDFDSKHIAYITNEWILLNYFEDSHLLSTMFAHISKVQYNFSIDSQFVIGKFYVKMANKTYSYILEYFKKQFNDMLTNKVSVTGMLYF